MLFLRSNNPFRNFLGCETGRDESRDLAATLKSGEIIDATPMEFNRNHEFCPSVIILLRLADVNMVMLNTRLL